MSDLEELEWEAWYETATAALDAGRSRECRAGACRSTGQFDAQCGCPR